MSNTPFVESLSNDPVEQAIARKVNRVLNDTTLDRQRRETLLRKAQRELIKHRQRKEHQAALLQQVAAVKLPRGYPWSASRESDRYQQRTGLPRSSNFGGLKWH